MNVGLVYTTIHSVADATNLGAFLDFPAFQLIIPITKSSRAVGPSLAMLLTPWAPVSTGWEAFTTVLYGAIYPATPSGQG